MVVHQVRLFVSISDWALEQPANYQYCLTSQVLTSGSILVGPSRCLPWLLLRQAPVVSPLWRSMKCVQSACPKLLSRQLAARPAAVEASQGLVPLRGHARGRLHMGPALHCAHGLHGRQLRPAPQAGEGTLG